MLTHRLALASLLALTISTVGCHYDHGHSAHHHGSHHAHVDSHGYYDYEYGSTIVEGHETYSDDTIIRQKSSNTESTTPALLPPPAPVPAKSTSAYSAPPTQDVFDSQSDRFNQAAPRSNGEAQPAPTEIDRDSFNQ